MRHWLIMQAINAPLANILYGGGMGLDVDRPIAKAIMAGRVAVDITNHILKHAPETMTATEKKALRDMEVEFSRIVLCNLEAYDQRG